MTAIRGFANRVIGLLSSEKSQLSKHYKHLYAQTALKFHVTSFRTRAWSKQQINRIVLLLIAVAIMEAILVKPIIQDLVQFKFESGNGVEPIQDLLLAVGTALIGATAIAFSFVLFAMQVNIERLPHGLFSRLSTDTRLIGAFVAAFVIAIAISTSSVISDFGIITSALIGALFGTFSILSLLLYSYRRALQLVNPVNQLEMIVESANSEMKIWLKRAILSENARPIPEHEVERIGEVNTERAVFFKAYGHWSRSAFVALHHLASYVEKYIQQGDYEIASRALAAVVEINSTYCEVKEGTFFGDSGLIEHPFATDGFINESLELLRQLCQKGLAAGDERQVELVFHCLSALIGVYLNIKYGRHTPTKTHAFIAAGYLTGAVESVASHELPDVMMEGVRAIAAATRAFTASDDNIGISELINRLGIIGVVGLAKKNHRPVTVTVMEQLASISMMLLTINGKDIGSAIRSIRSVVNMIGEQCLSLPEARLSSDHKSAMSPYFSSTSYSSFKAGLRDLTNAVLNADEDSPKAKAILRNVDKWAEGLYKDSRELLLKSTERQSSLTLDLMAWVSDVTIILIALSNSPACDDFIEERLKRHALWLISGFSFLPTDKESTFHLENSGFIRTLFETAWEAREREGYEVFEEIFKMLLTWGVQAGKHPIGMGILEETVYALSALALSEDGNGRGELLKSQLIDALKKYPIEAEVRHMAQGFIHEKAESIYYRELELSPIERAMAGVDGERIRVFLHEMADLVGSAQ